MASERQNSANQRNSAFSTGPKTPAGKARSSLNALKTGFFAKLLLLPDEDGRELHRLRAALLEEWWPVGITEIIQVDRLTALFWKQRRIYHAERGFYCMYRECPEGVGGVATALAKDGTETEAFSRSQQMDSAIERSIGITLRLRQQLQKDRGQRAGLATLPPAAPPPSPAS